MMRTADAAERLGVSRKFLFDVSREFPSVFTEVPGNLYGPNGGLVWREDFLRKMEILAEAGISGMPAARVAAVAFIEGDRIVIGGGQSVHAHRLETELQRDSFGRSVNQH